MFATLQIGVRTYVCMRLDDDCTLCTNCDDEYTGDECKYLYWVIDFKVGVSFQEVSEKRTEFEAVFFQDVAYLLDIQTSRLSIWDDKILSSEDGLDVTVYFMYTFYTDDEDTVQTQGGDLFINFGQLVSEDDSEVTFLCAQSEV